MQVVSMSIWRIVAIVIGCVLAGSVLQQLSTRTKTQPPPVDSSEESGFLLHPFLLHRFTLPRDCTVLDLIDRGTWRGSFMIDPRPEALTLVAFDKEGVVRPLTPPNPPESKWAKCTLKTEADTIYLEDGHGEQVGSFTLPAEDAVVIEFRRKK